VRGWFSGVSEDDSLTPAVYLSGYQYRHKGGAGYTNVFIAATTLAGTIPAHPRPTAANILGYIAYYASCGTADNDVATAESSNTQYNTLQFGKDSLICPP
jgi:hypothetical protein